MTAFFENLEDRRFLTSTPSIPLGGSTGSAALLAAVLRPSVAGTVPANGVTGISTLVSVKADVNLPNIGAGVSDATVKAPGNVTLVRVRDGANVQANINTTGG